MKKKYSLILDDEFILYCELNNINDIEKMAKQTFEKGFSLLKYPSSPVFINKEEPIIEKKEPVVEKEVITKKIEENELYSE